MTAAASTTKKRKAKLRDASSTHSAFDPVVAGKVRTFLMLTLKEVEATNLTDPNEWVAVSGIAMTGALYASGHMTTHQVEKFLARYEAPPLPKVSSRFK